MDAIKFGETRLQFYMLDSFVVMPNHVHLLIVPKVPPEHLLRSVKGYSARKANRILNQTVQPFWQHESYDRWVRK